MKWINFDNGDKMPMLGLGTWKSAPGDAFSAVKDAVDLGYRHIDCAAIYGNEPEIGRALDQCFTDGTVARKDMWITSKLWNNAHAPEDVGPALEKTLGDLRLDYLDLYLMHWPVAQPRDVVFPASAKDLVALDALPISETWKAMEALKDQGLCRHIGVCNFSVAKLKGLINDARQPPEMNQIELHPYLQQPVMVAFCRSSGIHLTAYSPLGSSDRPAHLKAHDEPALLEDPVIGAVAERCGATPAQVLIRWAIHRKTAVIPKSVRPAHMAQNMAAFDVTLSPEDLREIAGLDLRHRYVNGDFFAVAGGPYTLANLWDE